MAKYLFEAAYNAEGVKGVLKDGGTGRVNAVEKAVQNLGGSVDSFYFAFGGTDVFVVVDLPSNVDVAAVAMTVGSTGTVDIKTTVLLTPEEVDEATRKTVEYRAPGQ